MHNFARGSEFGLGYPLGGKTFDALVFGYYEGDRLVCVGRTRTGFTPALRALLWRKFRGLEIPEVPFREPARGPERTLGPGPDGGQDEKVPMAEAGPSRAVRVR